MKAEGWCVLMFASGTSHPRRCTRTAGRTRCDIRVGREKFASRQEVCLIFRTSSSPSCVLPFRVMPTKVS